MSENRYFYDFRRNIVKLQNTTNWVRNIANEEAIVRQFEYSERYPWVTLYPILSLIFNMSRRSKKIEKQLKTCHHCQIIFSSLDAYLHSDEQCQASVDLFQKYSLSAPHGYVWGNVFIAQIKVQQQEKNKIKKGNERDDRRKKLVKMFDLM